MSADNSENFMLMIAEIKKECESSISESWPFLDFESFLDELFCFGTLRWIIRSVYAAGMRLPLVRFSFIPLLLLLLTISVRTTVTEEAHQVQ